MKTLGVVMLLAVPLLAACSHKHDDGTPRAVGGSLPGMGTTTISKYSGSIQVLSGCGQTCIQTVAVNADVTNYPSDRVDVFICKNFNCTIGNIPSQDCASVNNQPSASCFSTIPFGDIQLAPNAVQFINAWAGGVGAGYSSYAIQTTVTR